ncbi:hypothetical protein ACUH89_06150 [Dermabacteraceae bacterium P13264]
MNRETLAKFTLIVITLLIALGAPRIFEIHRVLALVIGLVVGLVAAALIASGGDDS